MDSAKPENKQIHPNSLANLQKAGTPSHNPGGRPKGLASLLREKCGNGVELAEQMHQMLQGTLVVEQQLRDEEGNVRTIERKPDHRDIITAAQWFADRGWGKSVETVLTEQHNTPESIAKSLARLLENGGDAVTPHTQEKPL